MIVAEALGDRDRETGNALEFITERLAVHLRSEGVRHDIVRAAFLPTAGKGIEDNLVRLLARVDALTKFIRTDDGANLLTAYRRAANIVAIEERKDKVSYAGDASDGLLAQGEEEALAASLDEIGGQVVALVRKEEFAPAMAALARLRQPVDEFFERVTVNVDNTALRENRLRLLSRIRATMNQVADFSQIEG
jgi:glycyl-tRNA synthetase beta chain